MRQRALDPPVEAGPEIQTVPSVIDCCLDVTCNGNEERTFAEKKALLNRFARRYPEKLAQELIPYDVESWIEESYSEASDDYRAKVCSTIHAAFNWAASWDPRQERVKPDAPLPHHGRKPPPAHDGF
jgi:hypothetical protein